jgi:uncharacterized protein YecT (DUF1311 family)
LEKGYKRMRARLGIAALSVLLLGCDRWPGKTDEADAAAAAKARLEGMKETCASKLTYVRLKEYVFDQAAQVGNSDPRRLDPLAAHSVVRMDDPVVKSRDDDLNITVCEGRFVLNLPPGIHDAFGGKPVIEANVEYAAQVAADGSGLVYSMTGAEPIIYRIATLGLPNQPGSRLVLAPGQAQVEVPTELPEAPPPPPAATTATVKQSEAPRAQARAASPGKAAASPSFNCRHARTRSEKMVCGSGSLAAADRQMSATYYGQMARADAATKRALRRTRDAFLARRDRCSTDACVAQAYRERVAEIRRIAGE